MKSVKAVILNNRGQAGGNLVTILSVVNILITIGMVAILFISFAREKTRQTAEDIVLRASEGEVKEKGQGEGKEGEKKDEKKGSDFGKMINLEMFTVNLSTPGSINPKFIRVSISLEVPTEEVESEVNFKVPQVRNTIIDLINSKRPADLAAVEGREYLKEEIKTSINSFLISGKIKSVFFTGFALTG
ncbi:MAG: flagellar basal body-associated FliL family protein [Bdellovibrionia bacterium]